MKKLKILLSYNVILIFLAIFTLLRIILVFDRTLCENEKLGEKTIEGTVKSIEVTEHNTKILVQDTLITVKTNDFKLGNKVICKGEVSEPISQSNFYLFDYQKYLASRGIFYVMKGDCEVKDSSSNFFYQIKNKIIEVINKNKSRPYLKAFLLGDNKEIDQSVKRSYQLNGISHLFAVSGMHVGFFFLLFGKIFKKEKSKNLILFTFLLFYLFLTNFSPSVIRASLFFFFAKVFSKLGFSNLQSYAIFTMVMLWYRPYYLYHTGFLYSFTISFFLLYYSAFINSEKNYWKNLFKISFVAILSSIPIQVETNFSINLFSLLYNLIFAPIISQFLFPMSFLVFLFPFLDSFYCFLIALLENISLFFMNIPTHIVLCHLSPLYYIFYYGIFFFIMHKIKGKEYKYIVVLFFLLVFHFYFPRLNPNGMVLMMDVGQGDSTLIVYPHQKLKILVDTGGMFSNRSISENTIIPSMHAHGITTLDYLILSHGDFDHVGEARNLLEKVNVRKVFLNSGSETEEERKIIEYLKEKSIPYEKISVGTISRKGISIQFLNSIKNENENEDSLVCYLKIRKFSILLMGDSGHFVEKELLQEYNLPAVDILKVGHHGSKYSSSLEFISKISPSFCLISAGQNNRYGHPHRETLENLQFCDTYITSIDGAIKIKIGKSMHVTKVR